MTARQSPLPKTAETPRAGNGLNVFPYAGVSRATERVRRAVQRNLDAVPELFPFRAVAVTRSYRESEGLPLATRRAMMVERIMAEQPVVIQDGELIVGMKTPKPHGSPVYPEINCQWYERDLDTLAGRDNTPFFVSEETKRILREEVFPYWPGRTVFDRIAEQVTEAMWDADRRGVIYNYWTSRSIGHINVAYDKMLTRGVAGIRAEVAAALAGLADSDARAGDKRLLLEGIDRSLAALVVFAGRYAAEARRLAAVETDVQRRLELMEIARVCDKVPARPAETFHEALQAFHFTQLALHLETNGHAVGPGRFDQYIFPFYQADIAAGRITADQAQELLDLLWVKLDEITLAKNSGESDTSSSYPEFQNLNIGGLTTDGHDATNAVSHMCLTALEHVKLPQPQLSAQISTRTPQRFLLRCCELLKYGMGMPAMFNADTIVLGLVNRGKTLAEARRYGSINGCVATTCDGRDRMASSGYFNLAKCLELALNDGRDRRDGVQVGPRTGNPRRFSRFEDVLAAFKAQVEHFVDVKVRYDDIVRAIYADHLPVPVTSALIEDCVATATDWHAGGARYNIATISGVGIGTVADALSGIRTHVSETGRFGMADLIQALDDDFTGHEILHQTLVNRTPHYGNDDAAADALALHTQQVFCDAVESRRDCQGARYWVDLLPTTAHIALGRLTAATPDGRRAGHWLSEGISPVQGHDRKGPTAVAASVGRIDHARCNGNLLNMKISPRVLRTPADLRKLAALIRGYFDTGGHHVQFNVVDEALLRQARERPGEFRNLLVRVAGYSDFFVLLSRDIQEEIIARTAHDL
jgi:trans-4-hydroxy-L-proline dehydratase